MKTLSNISPFRPMLFVPVLALLIGGGYALGQNSANSDTQDKELAHELLEAQTAVNLGGSNDYGRLVDAYAQAPGRPLTTKQAARLGLVYAKKGDNGPALATLISQNQRLIEQNEQIIFLLKKNSAAK